MANPSSGVTAPTTAGSANASTLADWAGPYVTNMMGKANAIANEPYQAYQGPLTAGTSQLQTKVFEGLNNVAFPSNLGQSFSSTGAYAPPAMYPNAYDKQPIGTGGANTTGGIASLTPNQPAGATGIAAQYMNPYLQSVLDPQLAELRRQNDITQMNNDARMIGSGSFGGGRQAIMNSENNRNLMQTMNKTVGEGYSNAYDKAMNQFNTEQGQAKTIVDMLTGAGATQRGIEQEGITADVNEFNAQRDDPQKKVQFLQSMLQGLPISTVYNVPQAQTGAQQTVGTVKDTMALLEQLGIKL